MVIVMYSICGVKVVYVCSDSDVDVVVYKCYVHAVVVVAEACVYIVMVVKHGLVPNDVIFRLKCH